MAVNYNELQTELAERFGIKELRYLASGDDSDTFLGDDRYVIKVPRRESVIQMQRREFQLYSFLNRHEFSFQIPMAIYQGDYYNVMNYISGKRITYNDYTALSEKEQNALAIDEAAFLQELHNDFSAGNLIFRSNRLYGVIDFGDSVIGDPDNDFLYLLDSSKDDFGKESGRKVL